MTYIRWSTALWYSITHRAVDRGPLTNAAMSRGRNWCLTINNPTVDDSDRIRALDTSYYVIGNEVGEEGTPHLQCYIRLSEKKRFNWLKQRLPTAHIEIAKGSPLQNREYCTKDGDFEEEGEVPKAPSEAGGAANKAKWDKTKDLAKTGNFEDIDSDHFLKYYRTIKQIAKDYMEKPADLDHFSGMWLWGESGAGKSKWVRDNYPDAYDKPLNKWWDGYQGQETVHIEDVDPSHAKWIGFYLKRWTDHYAFIAEIKGGQVYIRPDRIIVTSQYSIDQCFNDCDLQTIQALKRRFEERLVCATPVDPVE